MSRTAFRSVIVTIGHTLGVAMFVEVPGRRIAVTARLPLLGPAGLSRSAWARSPVPVPAIVIDDLKASHGLAYNLHCVHHLSDAEPWYRHAVSLGSAEAAHDLLTGRPCPATPIALSGAIFARPTNKSRTRFRSDSEALAVVRPQHR